MANVIFKFGTQEQFNQLLEKDPNTLYWLEDVQALYKGDKLYGTGKEATAESAGLLSAADKEKLDSLALGSVGGTGITALSAIDGSILVTNGDEGEKKIGVQVSKGADNILSIEEDGLMAKAVTYTLAAAAEPSEGSVTTYELTEHKKDGDTVIGKIEIPKDKVVKSGTLKMAPDADDPYPGAAAGDPYIELVIEDGQDSTIYIPVKGLVDVTKFASKEEFDALSEKVDGLSSGTALDITAVDGTIIITPTEGGRNIKVGVSQETGNAVEVKEDGLFTATPVIPKYEIVKKDEATEGYNSTYQLKVTTGDAVTYAGEIDLPASQVIKGAELKHATDANVPYDGAEIGDPYLDIELADEQSSHIYVPVKDLVGTITGSDAITVEDNVVSLKLDANKANGLVIGENGLGLEIDTSKFVVGTVTGTQGKALIFNESDGGGAKFEQNAGLNSFVGVHDGTAIGDTVGLAAQLYAVDGSGLGSRVNVFQDRVTYISKEAKATFSGTYNNADYEIAVKKDLDALEKKLQGQGVTGAIVWEAIGQLSEEEMDAVVKKIASDTLGTYADITVSAGTVAATIKSDQGEVDINIDFGVKLLTALKNSGLKSVAVKDTPDSKIDLTGDAEGFKNVGNFVSASGLQANKLKNLDGKTLAIEFVDAGDVEHEYTINFTLAKV